MLGVGVCLHVSYFQLSADSSSWKGIEMQKQCPWCGEVGPRVPDDTPIEEMPPVPTHVCVCRHVSSDSRLSAIFHHGRYYDEDQGRWICMGGCKNDCPPTEKELEIVEEWRVAEAFEA